MMVPDNRINSDRQFRRASLSKVRERVCVSSWTFLVDGLRTPVYFKKRT